ncbi:MAG: HmuY family protein [Nitrospinaceae bacterium]
MSPTPRIFLMLLGATLLFHTTLNYMENNIEEFETVPLPPKKIQKISTNNSIIKIDAKDRNAWMLLEFSSGKTLKISEDEAETNKLNQTNWDMAFSRTKIITNGGKTNASGKTGVINLGLTNFDDIRTAPETGYVQDHRSLGNLINKELAGWYNYRTRTHNIESKRNVYAMKLNNGVFMKMRILNYYCGQKDQECRSMMCTRE